jgi:hypothetical protein
VIDAVAPHDDASLTSPSSVLAMLPEARLEVAADAA